MPDYEAEVADLYKAIDSLSDEFNEYLADKCDRATLNYLRVYGIPTTPAHVWGIFNMLYQGIPANLIKDGKLTPTEGMLAPEEVQAERAARRNKDQLSFDDVLSTIKDGKTSGFGTYI